MAEQPETKTDEPSVEETASLKQRVRDRLILLQHWVSASRLRMAVAGSLALVTLIATFALWSYLAHLAVAPQDPVTIEMALAALDARDTDEAKNLIGRLQQQTVDVESLGGSLFVLGAAKEYEADKEWSAERRRAMHLVAARYLQKSQLLGPPAGRESQLLFLLGRSLIRGNQPYAGIPVLKKALRDENLPSTEIHSLLADAYLLIPDPDFKAALKHNEALLSYRMLSPEVRTESLLNRAEILGRLGRTDDAREALSGVGRSEKNLARIKLLAGRLAIAEGANFPLSSSEREERIASALSDFRETQRLDSLSGKLTRRAMYWIGKGYELQGNNVAAIKQYDHLSKLYGDTAEGLAATLTEADLDRDSGRTKKSLAGYRTVLETVDDPVTYSNPLLPLRDLRKRLSKAYQFYLRKGNFRNALTLVEQLEPVFSRIDVAELRAKSHEEWGQRKLNEANDAPRRQADDLYKEGRFHLRAAGRAFEDVARLRFATRRFPEDLWAAANNYFLGHSYTHATRVIEEYLHHESRRNNGLALLRLGQAKLALAKAPEAIAALTDCIELHPRDWVIFQARLECARAYMENGQSEKAEQLLLSNLAGDMLTPISPEWRDSLFALGYLLHDTGRYLEAIAKLEEAIKRYPESPQTILASYIIARSFHQAAEEPKEKLKLAKTENERQKNRKMLSYYLSEALGDYQNVQRTIALDSRGHNNELGRTLLRNCYLMQGSVLFQLKRYEEARKAYANISTLYQHEPFVLESFVQIANCWQRLNQPVKAKVTIEHAKQVLDRLPADTDFKVATNFNRQEWKLLLDQMGKW